VLPRGHLADFNRDFGGGRWTRGSRPPVGQYAESRRKCKESFLSGRKNCGGRAISRLQTALTDARIAVMKSTAIQFWFWYFSPPDRGAGGGA
jgi:hypothetical protein